jgi:hypothetical protein
MQLVPPTRFLPTLASLLLAASAEAAQLRVPQDYLRIGEALAAAVSGDEVVVAAGIYAPSTNGEVYPLQMTTAGVALRGAGVEQSILDAEASGTVVELSAAGTRLRNFTITGGDANWGGGVHVLSADAEIDHNLIRDNVALNRGSGINVQAAAAPWIHHNVCWENLDKDLVHGGDPHGIQIGGSSTALVEHNLVGRGDSNGLFAGESSAPTVRNNIFFENGTPAVRGRGICALSDPATVIAYNLFSGNAISAIVINDGGIVNLNAMDANDYNLADNIYGNLDGDPLLLDAANLDFHLTPTSPAIDAGDPTSPLDTDGTRADIGPYVYSANTATPAGSSRFELIAAAPNPFTTEFSLRIRLRRPGAVTIELHDLRGRRLQSEQLLASGLEQQLILAGRDRRGHSLAAGVYIVSLESGGERVTLPVVKVR